MKREFIWYSIQICYLRNVQISWGKFWWFVATSSILLSGSDHAVRIVVIIPWQWDFRSVSDVRSSSSSSWDWHAVGSCDHGHVHGHPVSNRTIRWTHRSIWLWGTNRRDFCFEHVHGHKIENHDPTWAVQVLILLLYKRDCRHTFNFQLATVRVCSPKFPAYIWCEFLDVKKLKKTNKNKRLKFNCTYCHMYQVAFIFSSSFWISNATAKQTCLVTCANCVITTNHLVT